MDLLLIKEGIFFRIIKESMFEKKVRFTNAQECLTKGSTVKKTKQKKGSVFFHFEMGLVL